MEITGGCFCGAISYAISAPLSDARSCHCSRCRKVFSAQASAYAVVATNSLEWTSGQEHLSTYVGKHGAGVQFCGICGSTLCGVFDGAVHGVTLGCVDGDPQIEIGRHIYVGSKAAWEVMPEGVTAYEEAPPSE